MPCPWLVSLSCASKKVGNDSGSAKSNKLKPQVLYITWKFDFYLFFYLRMVHILSIMNGFLCGLCNIDAMCFAILKGIEPVRAGLLSRFQIWNPFWIKSTRFQKKSVDCGRLEHHCCSFTCVVVEVPKNQWAGQRAAQAWVPTSAPAPPHGKPGILLGLPCIVIHVWKLL